jgi:hypothetical protein
MIDKLELEQFRSSDKYNIYSQKVKLAPFKVTRYFLSEENNKKWNKYFSEHHNDLFSILNIDNIFSQFKEEQTRQTEEFHWETKARKEAEAELPF